MIKEIAVLIGKDGRTVSFFDPGVIRVYSKKNDAWRVIKEVPLQMDRTKGIKGVRESLMRTANELGNTRVLVAREITGMPYNILDTSGFILYEIDAMPEIILEYVYSKEFGISENREEHPVEGGDPIAPAETGVEGVYYMNLKELQSGHPEISSKKALLPFLKEKEFYELKVICSHIPPWFDTHLEELGLNYEAAGVGFNEFEVTVYHKTCDEVQSCQKR
ncbi:MAG: Fe-only nitrogenase accessory protein AnfO [Clostridia bacterium]|nr:Fe-only nitrogenase accessory protein AnfO [Clostridia bacterium]